MSFLPFRDVDSMNGIQMRLDERRRASGPTLTIDGRGYCLLTRFRRAVGLFGTTSIISRFFPLEIRRLSCERKNSLRMIVNSGCSSLRTFVSERHTSRRK